MKKWNHYYCEECGQVTIARHDNEGVTPFMLRCRATIGCEGFTSSCFFECDQSDNQIPHVIFYRPESRKDAKRIIKRETNEANREWLQDHYDKGGALMREGEGN